MVLDPLQLDTATWANMVDAARRRIAALSRSQWTLHAAVDPGVTLLELFAWLLEQRSYKLDQITPETAHQLLALLGQSVRRARPAATVVAFDDADHTRVAVGDVLEVRRRGKPPLAFTTDHALSIAPLVDGVALNITVADVDRTPELGSAPIELAAPGGTPWRVEIAVTTSKPLVADADHPLTLLFELETSADVLPQWHPEAPDAVPPPAALGWTYAASGSWQPFAKVDDGTGGLRRTGVVALPIAADWAPAGSGPYTYRLAITTPTPSFSFPPRLVGLVANVAVVRQRRAVTATLAIRGSECLPIAGWLELPLDADDPPLRDTVQLTLLERDGVKRPWQFVEHLATSGPADRRFVVDRNRRVVTFGDGLTGRMPTLLVSETAHGPNVWIGFDASTGAAGNIGAGARLENPAHGWSATSRTPAIGGSDDEPVTDARARSASDLRAVTRAVLAGDYVELAVTTPGVGIARAHAGIGVHPAFACLAVPGAVTVFVVPFAPRPDTGILDEEWDRTWVWAPVPDPGALEAVRRVLDAARLVATELYVCPPRYRDVSIGVTLRGDPADPQELVAAVRRRLRRFLDPLCGGDRGEGWPFGEPLRPSALLREAQAAIGPAADAIGVHLDVAGRTAQSTCSDVPLDAHELPRLRDVSVELDRVVTTSGGLR